ncbi:hypothetical protein NS330_16000 [Curtobacterium citreum]|nr:hypothetical protein NS330_16000 [Curtobacterium citreum]
MAAAATRTSTTTDQGEPTDGGDPRLQADAGDETADAHVADADADVADAAPTQHTEKEPTA